MFTLTFQVFTPGGAMISVTWRHLLVENWIITFWKNAILLYWYKYCKLIRARWIILSWDEDENQTNHEDEKKSSPEFDA